MGWNGICLPRRGIDLSSLSMLILSIIQYSLLIAIVIGVVYYLLSLIAAGAFFLQYSNSLSNFLPSVTLLVPLCGEDFEAFENFCSLCSQDYPDYQIVFGVRNFDDRAIPVIRHLEARFPDRDIQLIISKEEIGSNLKVSNLQNMLVHAKNEHIVIIDSDIRVEKEYLRTIIPPLVNPHVGLVTCLYRSSRTPNLASRLEALGITTELMPGVLVSRLIEGVRFALGATMATTRARLQAIGGFQRIANHLADDYMLGHLLTKAGYEIHLSHGVVETLQPAMSFTAMLKHQVRLARGIRACRPLGHLGLIFTYGTVLSLLYSVSCGLSFSSLFLLGGTTVLRLFVGLVIGGYWLNDRALHTHFWLLPLRDLLGFLVWSISLFGSRVEWRGEVFKLQNGGVITSSGKSAKLRNGIAK
jgi:ceramide glucosyltransferase